MEDKPLQRLYTFVYEYREKIKNIFGVVTPGYLFGRCTKLDEFILNYLSNKHDCLYVVCILLKFIKPDATEKEIVIWCLTVHREIISLLRLLSHFLHNEIISENLVSGHPVTKVLVNILALLGGVKLQTDWNTLNTIHKYSIYHKFLTYTKRLVSTMLNDRITLQWLTSDKPEYLCRIVNPDRNFAYRLAYIESIVNSACLLSFSDLLYLLDVVSEWISYGYAPGVSQRMSTLSKDADVLYVFYILNIMAKARFKTKVLEINEPCCSCHAKCNGLRDYAPESYDLEEMFYNNQVLTHASTHISPVSRLSLIVDNTTSYKPRRTVLPTTPSLSTCSTDACTTPKFLQLYFLTENDNGFFYSHRFYISNSTPITDMLYRNLLSTATGRYYGICYGGERTCWKAITSIIKSCKQYGLQDNFTESSYRWKCNKCQRRPLYNKKIHNFPDPLLHDNTCVMFIYNKACELKSVEQAVKKYYNYMCKGCRASLMCHHTLTGFTQFLKKQTSKDSIMMRLSLLVRLLG